MIDIQTENWLCDLLPKVVALAREAGQAIMTVYAEASPEVEYKRDDSPLTQADLASHHVLVEGLAGLSPEWPVISEESVEIPFDQRRYWRHFWMIDPLDGTKEFLRRTGEFTVNIALIEDDRPILGVVYAPVIDKLYFAARGAGSHRVDGEVTTPIRVASTKAASPRLVVSRSHASEQEKKGGEFIVMG